MDRGRAEGAGSDFLRRQRGGSLHQPGVVASTDPGWLQTAFDTLTGLFDRVGLKMNVHKIVGMVCHPFRADGLQADKAYTRKMTGVGRSYKERQQERVN